MSLISWKLPETLCSNFFNYVLPIYQCRNAEKQFLEQLIKNTAVVQMQNIVVGPSIENNLLVIGKNNF